MAFSCVSAQRVLVIGLILCFSSEAHAKKLREILAPSTISSYFTNGVRFICWSIDIPFDLPEAFIVEKTHSRYDMACANQCILTCNGHRRGNGGAKRRSQEGESSREGS